MICRGPMKYNASSEIEKKHCHAIVVAKSDPKPYQLEIIVQNLAKIKYVVENIEIGL